MIAHLDYIAVALVLFGYLRIGGLKIDGWLWTCLGSILLVIFGIFIVPSAMGVAIGNAVFAGLAIRGFIKWRRKNKLQ